MTKKKTSIWSFINTINNAAGISYSDSAVANRKRRKKKRNKILKFVK